MNRFFVSPASVFSLALLGCLALGASPASADTVLKLDFAGGTAPDVMFSGLELTVGDDGAGSAGKQLTGVTFEGFLSGETNIPPGAASFTLSGLMTDGMDINDGSGIEIELTGGVFTLYDESDSVLLTGNLVDSFLFGGSIPVGALYTPSVTYTGGSLLPQLDPNSGSMTISLGNVMSGGVAGMVVNEAGVLQDFTASATGQFDAAAVPEPSMIGFAAVSAVVMIRRQRRRRKSVA